MESVNPYQSPAADVAAIPGQDGFDQTGGLSPKGRFGRLSYIAWGMLVGVAAWLAMAVVMGGMTAVGPDALGAAGPMSLVLQIIIMIPMIIFAIRRLHDFNASGWWSLMIIVPIVNLFFSAVLLFKAGNPGANRFAPPRVTRGWEKVLGYIGIGFIVIAIIGLIAAIAIPALAPR